MEQGKIRLLRAFWARCAKLQPAAGNAAAPGTRMHTVPASQATQADDIIKCNKSGKEVVL